VLVVLDTVRRDRLSLYGYERETTPFLEELAASSRLYTNAYSTSSWTAPAHASLFTGLFPIAHGATQEGFVLDAAHVTLAERLSRAGYRTFGITENAVISSLLGYGQGFERYHHAFKHRERDPLEVLRELLHREERRPFFAFVNLMTAHAPYDGVRGGLPELRHRFLPKSAGNFRAAWYRWHGFYGGYQSFSPTVFLRLGDLYDSCILTLDRRVRAIAELLQELGAWENTIFILTSDHGENLGEKDHYEHLFSLYQPTLRIPLLIRYPSEFPPGSRDARPVQLTDIVPTLMSLLGLEGVVKGRDLRDSDFDESRLIFAEYYRPEQALEVLENVMRRRADGLWEAARGGLEAKYLRRLRTVVQNDIKLIRSDGGSVELYDLSLDPEESTNRADDAIYADRRAELERALSEFVAGAGEREERAESEALAPNLDRETRAELRALGYLE